MKMAIKKENGDKSTIDDVVMSRNVHSIVEILYVNFILFGRIFCSVCMKCEALFEELSHP